MILYTEFLIVITLLTIMGLADAVLVKNNSAVLYPALIFGLHLPLVLLFVMAVFIARYYKEKRKTKAVYVNQQSTPAVNVQPQSTPIQNIQSEPTCVSVGHVKVPRYWSDSGRDDKTQFIDITNESQPVKVLVYDLWKPDEVGKGRDAKPTAYKYIHIHNVTRVQNIELYTQYYLKKKMMIKKENYIEYFKDLSEVANLPVQTTDLIQRTPDLKDSFLEIDIDHAINEHYLFHGTGSIAAAESICRKGLSTSYAAGGLFGKGLYTAENPTKSDQYTGMKDGENTLLLLRVCLGEIFVLRNTTDSGSLDSPPCRTCYSHKCSDHEHTFDSVVTDVKGMRFREFVVYRDYRVYPEYIITYERVPDDSEMRQNMSRY